MASHKKLQYLLDSGKEEDPYVVDAIPAMVEFIARIEDVLQRDESLTEWELAEVVIDAALRFRDA